MVEIVMLNWLENSNSVIFRSLREFQHLKTYKIPKRVWDDTIAELDVILLQDNI